MNESAESAIATDIGGVARSDVKTVIKPRSGWQAFNLFEIWRFRQLLWMFALRDISVRYKQTALGVLWAIIQPFVTMVVLSIFFGNFLGVADKVKEVAGASMPYPVFLFAGMLPWNFFSQSVGAGSSSLVSNAAIIRKVYVPRQILPISVLGRPLLDFLVGFAILFVLMLWYGVPIRVTVLAVPVLIMAVAMAALGVGFLLSGLTVRYRDFQFMVGFMIQLWFYVTPVIYPINVLPKHYHWLLQLNPMAGLIESLRACILGSPWDGIGLVISLVVSVCMLILGLAYFNRVERLFADVA